MCLLEAERTLDREVVEMLLLKAGRYLEETKRTMARVASPPDHMAIAMCGATRTTTGRTQAVDGLDSLPPKIWHGDVALSPTEPLSIGDDRLPNGRHRSA
jgi:hypothetical protein